MRTFIFLLCTTVFGFTTNNGLAQEKVNIEQDKIVSVDEVFEMIINQTKFSFLYPADLFKDTPKVKLKKGVVSVSKLLKQTLPKGQFNIVLGLQNRITIKKKNKLQKRQISGKVTDISGEPLPNVTVCVKGTNKATAANFNGEYKITIADNANVLVFTSIGFEKQEVIVGSQTIINITLKEAVGQLDEIVINAGYYNTTKREITGSISRVTAEEIESQPVTSPIEALQGRMAGVSIVQRSGIPGVAPQIQIRGQNSLRNSFGNNGNLPLYIIDGLPIDSNPITSFSGATSSTTLGLDPLSTLNLSNIESIEVLKDADATAIYGSRGANGVILITTKKGMNFEQKTKLNVSYNSGISQVSNFLNILKTEDYITLREEAFANDGTTPTSINARDLLLWDRNRYTDWQKELVGGTAETTNVNVSISGGSQNTSFQLTGGMFKTGTVFPGDFGYKKFTTGLSLNHRNNDGRFKARLSINYGIDDNNQFNSSSLFSDAVRLAPNAPALYNEDGSLNWENSTWTNPLAVTLRESNAKTQQLITSLNLSYEISKNLTFKTNAGYNMLNSNEIVNNPVEAYDPSVRGSAQARSSLSQTYRDSWIFEPQLVYKQTIENWKIDALIGATFQERQNRRLSAVGVGFANEELVGNLATADAVYITDNPEINYKYNAIFARLGLNFKGRYLLNLTGRRDGSSRFGPNNRFENFGALGAAWIFSDEKFAAKIPWLSFGKLRGSYGITGNDQIQDYGYLDTFSPTAVAGGLYPTQLVNPNYSWEINKKLETALELGFLKDRLRLQLSWYKNRSSNQLVGFTLPSITGFNTVQANLPATIENTGLEIEWSSINIKTENWRWQTNFNLTLPENRLVSYPGIEESSYATSYRVGEPLNIRMLYRFNGIDPATGLYQVEDVNQDGSFNFEDRVVVKDVGRQFFGGIQNQINYKNLSFSFLLEFVKQEGARPPFGAPGRFNNILQNEFDNRWLNPGDTNVTQRSSNSIAALFSDSRASSSGWSFVDASFVRLKSMMISYNLPLKTKLINSSRIFMQGQNLFTLTNYVGVDPQRPGAINLPVLRTISLGLEINF